MIAAGAVTTVFGFAETISYAVAGNGLHRPAAFVGILAAVQGAGAVTGGLTAAPLVRRLGEGRLIGVGMLVAAAGAALEVPRFRFLLDATGAAGRPRRRLFRASAREARNSVAAIRLGGTR